MDDQNLKDLEREQADKECAVFRANPISCTLSPWPR